MPTTVQAAFLGVVQGLTEFLPVSSSAHLILARAFFGFDGDRFGLSFDVACHVGTLVAVIIFFRRDLAQMVASLPRLFSPGPPQGGREQDGAPKAGGDDARGRSARLIWLLVAGTTPAIVVGLLFNNAIEEHMRTPAVAAAGLALGALGLFAAERSGPKTRGAESLTMADACWIGCAQALALVPGVSRSGITITLAMFLGLRRPEAARFIFLLAIPAILAAAAHEAPKVIKAGVTGDMAALFAIGVVASAIVGYLAVVYFIRYLADHSLDGFAWYRLALAVATFVWVLR